LTAGCFDPGAFAISTVFKSIYTKRRGFIFSLIFKKKMMRFFLMRPLVPKRIEYKEATLGFGRRRLLNFEVFKGLHRKERGGGGGTGFCLMAAILLAGILTLSTQLATC
jgi:hypothetical protein